MRHGWHMTQSATVIHGSMGYVLRSAQNQIVSIHHRACVGYGCDMGEPGPGAP